MCATHKYIVEKKNATIFCVCMCVHPVEVCMYAYICVELCAAQVAINA